MAFVLIFQGRCTLKRIYIHGYHLVIKDNSYIVCSLFIIILMLSWYLVYDQFYISTKNNTNVQNEISINWLSAFIWSLSTRDLLSYSCLCLSTTNVYFHVCCVIIIIHNYSVAFFQNNWYKEINISLESRIGQYSI